MFDIGYWIPGRPYGSLFIGLCGMLDVVCCMLYVVPRKDIVLMCVHYYVGPSFGGAG